MELVDTVCKNFEDYAQAKTKSSGEPVIIRCPASLLQHGLPVPLLHHGFIRQIGIAHLDATYIKEK
jgi:hypothetical protein